MNGGSSNQLNHPSSRSRSRPRSTHGSRSRSRPRSRPRSRSRSPSRQTREYFLSTNAGIISSEIGGQIANNCMSIVTNNSVVLPDLPSFEGMNADEAMYHMRELIEATNSFKYLRRIIQNVFKDNIYGNRFYIPSLTLLTNSSRRNISSRNLQRVERNKLNNDTLSSFEVVEDILQIVTKCFYFISVTYFGIPHMGNAIDVIWNNVSEELLNWFASGNLSMGPMTFKIFIGAIAVVIGFGYRWGTQEISQTSMTNMAKDLFGYIIDNLFIYGMAMYNYLEAMHYASMYIVYKSTNGCCYYGNKLLRSVYEFMRLRFKLDSQMQNSPNDLPGFRLLPSSSCESGNATSTSISHFKGGNKNRKKSINKIRKGINKKNINKGKKKSINRR